jgi:hypothetical protein
MAEMLNHAVHRLMERTEQDVGRKEIVRAIESRNMVFAKKLTNSRSLVYVITPSGVVKVVLHKPTGKVITVLPWKGEYHRVIKFNSPYGIFQAEIYPDCYLETSCKTALTKIIRIHPDGVREPIAFNHPLFDNAFTAAWSAAKREGNETKIEAEVSVNGTHIGKATELSISI